MTHINAFYLDVQEKKLAVDVAQAELDAAKERLKAHPDYVAPKKSTSTTANSTTFTAPKVSVDKTKNKKKK